MDTDVIIGKDGHHHAVEWMGLKYMDILENMDNIMLLNECGCNLWLFSKYGPVMPMNGWEDGGQLDVLHKIDGMCPSCGGPGNTMGNSPLYA